MMYSVEKFDILQITIEEDGHQVTTNERVLYIDEEGDRVVTIDMESKTGCHYRWRKFTDIVLGMQTSKITKLAEQFGRSLEFSWVNKRVREAMQKQLKQQEDVGLLIEETKAQRLYRERMEAVDKAYDIVQMVVPLNKEPECYRRRVNSKAVKDAAEKHGVTTKTVYKYVRRFLQGRRSKDALFTDIYIKNQIQNKEIKNKLGRPSDVDRLNKEVGGSIITKDMEQLFSFAICHKYETRARPSLSKTYDWLAKEFMKKQAHLTKEITKGVAPIPSKRQFRYWYKTQYENLTNQLIQREGETKFLNDYRAKHGDVWSQVSVPGQWYEIDATVADVYLINRINGEIIANRPTIYVSVDAYTGMITGLSITLEAPSISAALSLIYNTIENKVDYCKRVANMDIKEEDWPAQGIPNSITGDRGEMVSPKFEEVIKGLSATIKNVPPCLGAAKGIVEQCFNVLNIDVIHDLPGHIESEYRKRREPDYRLDAVLDIEEFTRIIIKTILHRNKKLLMNRKRTPEMIKQNVQLTPLGLWNYGIKKRSLMRNYPPQELIMKLMKVGKASITEKGIYFSGAYYGCNHPDFENKKVEAKNRNRIPIDIRYDDRDISNIFWVRHDSTEPVVCSMLDTYQEYEIFAHKTYQEAKDYAEEENRNVKGQSWEQKENDIDKDEMIQEEVKKAKQRQAGVKPKVKNVKTQKQQAKEKNKSEEALWKKVLGQNEENEKTVTVNNEVQSTKEEMTKSESLLKKGLLGELYELKLRDEE